MAALVAVHALALALAPQRLGGRSAGALAPRRATPVAPPVRMAVVVDHRAVAAGLFGNMRAPAALIAGAAVPIAFGFALPKTNCTALDDAIVQLDAFTMTCTLLSELLAVVYATVAVNKLSETAGGAPAESVLALLRRDYELEWAGTNFLFLLGLFGLAAEVGMRMVLKLWAQPGARWVPAALSASAACLMASTVNRGVARGDGSGRVRLGASFASLGVRYVRLLWASVRGGGGEGAGPAALVAPALLLAAGAGAATLWRAAAAAVRALRASSLGSGPTSSRRDAAGANS